ncbi:MAG: hypothetical protein NC483_00655 [Ruminococcus sp.]|nr:hypothetical protein [Ruminococcus sp.]
MRKSIHPKNQSGYYYYFDNVNTCPICKRNISPNYLEAYYHEDIKQLSVYCECTFCNKPFVALFSKTTGEDRYYNKLEYLAPEIPEIVEFDSHISNLSVNFVKIYNEALSAEIYNLNNIAGIGYRKALEFLIKDYCIFKNPNKESEIKSQLLGQVIDNYIDSVKIKNLSKASIWIGNDETHYIRKFEDKDINDLKMFIDATVNFINYELISDEATSLVSNKSSS